MTASEMTLNLIERWIRWIGVGVGFVILALALWRGVWQGLRQPSGRTTGAATRVLRTPLLLLFGALWIGVCFILWQPLPITLTNPARVVALSLGALLYFPGLALNLWGVRTMGVMYSVSSGFGVRLNRAHRLVTHGPFALVRHPIYLGLQVAAIGGLLLYRTWTFVFVTLNFLGLVLRARREEQALSMEFGEQWEAYVRRVPAWIPRIHLKARKHGKHPNVES
jgi:protein-S-isoprenylcysteine O-methyltransferase Ste14